MTQQILAFLFCFTRELARIHTRTHAHTRTQTHVEDSERANQTRGPCSKMTNSLENMPFDEILLHDSPLKNSRQYSRSYLCQGGHLIDGNLIIFVVSHQCLDLHTPNTYSQAPVCHPCLDTFGFVSVARTSFHSRPTESPFTVCFPVYSSSQQHVRATRLPGGPCLRAPPEARPFLSEGLFFP